MSAQAMKRVQNIPRPAQVGDRNKVRPQVTQTQHNGNKDKPKQKDYCLICNIPCFPNGKNFSRRENPRGFREVIFKAFDIEVDPGYFEEAEGDVPLCSACTFKCGQLKIVAAELDNIQREFDRLREDIAFSIVDLVASGAVPKKKAVNTDRKPPASIYSKVQNVEVELIQQLIFESWHDRIPTDDLDGEESYFDASTEDMYVEKEEPAEYQTLQSMVQKSNATKSGSGSPSSSSTKSGSSGGSTAAGKTTLISITTRDEKPSTSFVRRRTTDSDGSGSTIEKNVDIDLSNRQITITNEKGVVLSNSSVGLTDDPNPVMLELSPDRKEDGFSASATSPDCMDSDFDEGDPTETEFDLDADALITPQLDLSTELLKHSQRQGRLGGKKMPHDLQITEWSGSSDESQQQREQSGSLHVDEEDGQIDDMDMTFEELEEGGIPGRRNGRTFSSSSDNQSGQNSNELEFQQNEEGLYVCMFCNKTFIHKYPYRDHLKTHTGEGPRCPICNKIFPKNHNLMLHMRTHTGEKPYKCEVCRKGFADKSNLKVHMRVHTGERPYKCEFCDQAFVNSSRLVVHRRLHTGEKPFPCDMCPRSFSTSNQLQTHRKVHFTGKPFACEICGKGYANMASLNAHVTHFHDGEGME